MNMRRILKTPTLRMNAGGSYGDDKTAAFVAANPPKPAAPTAGGGENRGSLQRGGEAPGPAPAMAPAAPPILRDGNSFGDAASLRQGSTPAAPMSNQQQYTADAVAARGAGMQATSGDWARTTAYTPPGVSPMPAAAGTPGLPVAAAAPAAKAPTPYQDQLAKMTGAPAPAATPAPAAAPADSPYQSLLRQLEAQQPNFTPMAMPTIGMKHGGDLRTGMGGHVPGSGKGDKIDAKYEPGEFVVSNDMLEKAPGLRDMLHGLRSEALADKGMTPEQADAKAVSGPTLRANNGLNAEQFHARVGEKLRAKAASGATSGLGLAPLPAPSAPAPTTAMGNAFSEAKNLRVGIQDTPLPPKAMAAPDLKLAEGPFRDNSIKFDTRPQAANLNATTSPGAAPPRPNITQMNQSGVDLRNAQFAERANWQAQVAAEEAATRAANPRSMTVKELFSRGVDTGPAKNPMKFAPPVPQSAANAAANAAVHATPAAPAGPTTYAGTTLRGVFDNLRGKSSMGPAQPMGYAAKAGDLAMQGGRIAGKVAGPAIGLGMEGKDVYDVAVDPNSTQIDVGTQFAEGAGKLAMAGLGAKGGAALGALGGPLAPLTVPLGAVAGGAAGYFGGEKLIGSLRGMAGADPRSPDQQINDRAAAPAQAAPAQAAPAASAQPAFQTITPATPSAKLGDTREVDEYAGTMEVFTKGRGDKAGWTTVSTPGAKAERALRDQQFQAQRRQDFDDATTGPNGWKTRDAERQAREDAAKPMYINARKAFNEKRGQDMTLRAAMAQNETSRANNAATNAVSLQGHQMDLEGKMAPIRQAKANQDLLRNLAQHPDMKSGDPALMASALTGAGRGDLAKQFSEQAAASVALAKGGDELTKNKWDDIQAQFKGQYLNPDKDGNPEANAALESRAFSRLKLTNPDAFKGSTAQRSQAIRDAIADEELMKTFGDPQDGGFASAVPSWLSGNKLDDRTNNIPGGTYLQGAKIGSKVGSLRGALSPGNLEGGDRFLELPGGRQNLNLGKLSADALARLQQHIDESNAQKRK